MDRIFRWNGKYFGFISHGCLFDRSSQYLGWVEDDRLVWRANGSFLGELREEGYILRRTSSIDPIPRIARIPPISPISPIASVDRIGRIGLIGHADALDEFK